MTFCHSSLFIYPLNDASHPTEVKIYIQLASNITSIMFHCRNMKIAFETVEPLTFVFSCDMWKKSIELNIKNKSEKNK